MPLAVACDLPYLPLDMGRSIGREMTQEVHTVYSVAKDFQPAFAALVALGAAYLAYRAAMTRVRYDANVATVTNIKFRAGLCMRLVHRTSRLAVTASALQAWMTVANLTTDEFAEDIKIWPAAVPELDEAWSNVELLPKGVVTALEGVRNAHYQLAQFLKAGPDVRFDAARPKTVSKLCAKLLEYTTDLQRTLDLEIITIDRAMERAVKRLPR